jgi:hypothetical protein
MTKKTKRKKIAKKAAPKKVAKGKAVKRQAVKRKVGKKRAAKKTAMDLGPRFCFNMTADPQVVIRCEFGPDGRCNQNCVAIPISQMPSGASLRKLR